MPQINENVWGEGFGLYADYINKRTGTNDDITNVDYTNFPPFCFISQNTTPPPPENFTSALRTIYARGGVNLNEPIDETICYVGMYDVDLPQLNIGVYFAGDTQDNPTFKTDNTQIQSYFLYGTLDLFHTFPNHNYMPNGFMPVPDYANYTKYIYWSPNAETSNYPDTTNYNTNLKIDPYLKWGLKSFFLVIYVVYISSYDGSSQPISTQTTLNDYLNGVGHDDTWKTQHPVMCAFGMPYIRRSTSGEYNTQIYGYTPVMPAFTLPYIGEYNGDNYDIISYIATLSGTAVDTTAPNIGHFPIYGSLTPYQYQYPYAASTNRNGAIMCGINRGEYKKAPNNDVYWFELDLTNPDNVEYLMRGCAAYGLFFSDDVYTLAQSGRDIDRWFDNNMCCGTIDENGRTNGDYTRGVNNVTQRQFNWSDSTESPYDPLLPPIPENDYDNTTIFNSIGDNATMFKRYVLNGTNVEQLGADLFKITVDNATTNPKYDDYATVINSSMLVSNPLESIVSLQRYPMAIPHGGNVTENIKLGTNTCTAIGYPMSKTCYEYAFKGKPIMPRFGDSFLDYEPYTKFELYIPFCGTVELSPRDILNRDLSARLVVDYSTGSCTGYVLSDNLVIETVNGNIAIDIPVTGLDSATIQSGISNAVANASAAKREKNLSILSSFTSGILNPFKFNPVNDYKKLQESKETSALANYAIQHTTASAHNIGSATPCGAWAIDLKCRLLIYYPTGDILKLENGLPVWDNTKLAVYGMSNGFATCEPAQIKDYTTGLVSGVNPILNGTKTNTNNIAATAGELALIRQAIENGVIL